MQNSFKFPVPMYFCCMSDKRCIISSFGGNRSMIRVRRSIKSSIPFPESAKRTKRSTSWMSSTSTTVLSGRCFGMDKMYWYKIAICNAWYVPSAICFALPKKKSRFEVHYIASTVLKQAQRLSVYLRDVPTLPHPPCNVVLKRSVKMRCLVLQCEFHVPLTFLYNLVQQLFYFASANTVIVSNVFAVAEHFTDPFRGELVVATFAFHRQRLIAS